MFSTPSLRTKNYENADSVMRKPQVSSSRKAFQDRSVNSKINNPLQNTPFNKPKINLFSDLGVKAPESDVKPEEVPTWMMESSYVNPEFEFDTLHLLGQLSKAETRQLFMPTLQTPPPSPIGEDNLDMMFLDLPNPTALIFKFTEEDVANNESGLWDYDDLDDFVIEKPVCNFDF